MAQWVAVHALQPFKTWDLLWFDTDTVPEIAEVLRIALTEEKYIPSQILISIGQDDLLSQSTACLREQFQAMFAKAITTIDASKRRKCTAKMIISPIQPQLIYPTYNKQSAARKKWLGLNRKINALATQHHCMVTPFTGINPREERFFADGDRCLSPEAVELLAHSWMLALTSNMC